MSTKLVFDCLNAAKNNYQHGVIKTAANFYNFNFVRNLESIKYEANTIIIYDGISKLYIDCSSIVSIEITK